MHISTDVKKLPLRPDVLMAMLGNLDARKSNILLSVQDYIAVSDSIIQEYQKRLTEARKEIEELKKKLEELEPKRK
jgi:peptidoglycan hydrolase CwlO-like protein